MSLAKDMVKDYFVSGGVTPEEVNENVLRMTYVLNGAKANIYLIFGDSDRYVSILIRDFAMVPEDKKEAMCVVLNDINAKYKYAKFSVEEQAIIEQADVILTLDSCAEIIHEYIIRLTQILEESYKDIMRGIWA